VNDADTRKRQAREQLAAARKHGLAARHRAKLANVRTTEQIAMSIALAALRRDHQGVALLLASIPPQQGLQAASVALGAISELALTTPPDRIQTAREAMRGVEAIPSGGGKAPQGGSPGQDAGAASRRVAATLPHRGR
jgi:hypothetical protein